MLQSVLCNAEELKKLADEFGDRTLQRSLLDMNVDLLKHVVAVLQHFDTATRMLSTDRTPSLHLVCPTKKQLTKKLKPEAGDCAAVADMKSQLSSKLNDLFAVKPLHHLATLLDPRLKAGVLSNEERSDAVAALRKLADEVQLVDPSCSNEDASSEPSAKRRKVNEKSTSESDFFDDLFQSTEAVAVDEVDSYLSSTDSVSDVLSFWKAKEATWPKLAHCARWVLSVPATSTSSERVFSAAGRTLDDRRSQLKPETVDGLLFLHGLSGRQSMQE